MSIEALTPPAAQRPIYTYKIPASVDAQVSVIGLLKLTAQEEKDANARMGAADGGVNVFTERAKQAIAKVNGQRVSIADGTVEEWWSKFTPQLRALVVAQFQRLNTPTDEDFKAFQSSETVELG